nr:immunoglobulin light chain junction region [Macaca mulatta]
CVQSIAFPYSF